MIVASMYCLNIFHPGRLLGSGGAPEKEVASLDSRTDFPGKEKDAGELGGCGCVPKHTIDECSKV